MYTIMVIEDDPVLRRLLHTTLTSAGYECLLSANASNGRETCAAQKPDLVLLDAQLPDENGIEVCRRMKSDEKLRHIPILILTGEAFSLENRIDGLEAGAEDYLLKPFSHRELLSRIQGILRTATKPTHC